MGKRLGAIVLLVAIVFAVWGCGDNGTRRSNVPVTQVSTVERGSGGYTTTNATALRAYLRAWEGSWRRRGSDLERTGDGLNFSAAPDATWPRAQRYYEEAAIAYQNSERRLAALSPPSAMRPAHAAYTAAVRRQETRFQRLADAFAGTDPETTYRSLQALQQSQLQFDVDGAEWERAVIAACRASGMRIPKIVRQELVSNGQRTT